MPLIATGAERRIESLLSMVASRSPTVGRFTLSGRLPALDAVARDLTIRCLPLLYGILIVDVYSRRSLSSSDNDGNASVSSPSDMSVSLPSLASEEYSFA